MSYISKECIGVCPICGSDNIEYGDTCIEFQSLGYEVTCNDCGAESIEWFDLVYANTTSWTEDEE